MPELDGFLAGLLAQHGVTPEVQEKQKKIKKTTPTKEDLLDTPQRVDFRGEAVVVSLEHPTAEKIVKECKRESCKAVYTTNYRPVGYCTRKCLELDLKERFGLAWFPARDMQKERWEIRAEPFMIPEKALIAMKQLVTYVETELGRSLEIGSQMAFPQVTVVEESQPEPVSTQSVLASLGIEPEKVSPQYQENPPSRKIEESVPKEQLLQGFGGLFDF